MKMATLVVPSKKINEQLAYWLGFMLADGCILGPRNTAQKTVVLGLKYSDRKHIEKFAQYLKYNGSIFWNKKAQQWSVRITSDKLANLFEEFGIVPRKTLVAKVDSRLENNRHFWRGMIDGDGNIGSYSTGRSCKMPVPRILLCGTNDVCISFKKYCESINSGISINNIVKHGKTIKAFALKGRKAKQVIYKLYNNASIYLDRKFLIAKNISNF